MILETATFPQTIYAVAILYKKEGVDRMVCPVFVVSGAAPLTTEEAKARGKLQAERVIPDLLEWVFDMSCVSTVVQEYAD